MFHNNNGRASHGTFFKPCAQVPWPCAWAMAAMRVLHEQTLHQIEYLCIKCGRRGLFCAPRILEVPHWWFWILKYWILDCNGPFRFFWNCTSLPSSRTSLRPLRGRRNRSERARVIGTQAPRCIISSGVRALYRKMPTDRRQKRRRGARWCFIYDLS